MTGQAGQSESALLREAGLDTVAGAFACDGGEVLSKRGLGRRERIRLRLTDPGGGEVIWYLKRYHRAPWPVRGRRRLSGRGRPGPAGRELENIRRVRAAGVATMRAVAGGEESDGLGVTRGYLVVTAVPGDALERCLADFLARFGGDDAAMERFNSALAELASRLHSAGCVHRDLYASHVFLDETPDGPRLYLIDLARVFVPRWRRFRWRVKDLAELKYSMPPEWVERWWTDFLGRYLGAAGRRDRWAAAIDRKVACIRRRDRRRSRRH